LPSNGALFVFQVPEMPRNQQSSNVCFLLIPDTSGRSAFGHLEPPAAEKTNV
jgi:hypothetical protein